MMKFLLGETKEIRIQVISTRGDTFTIQSANWELHRLSNSSIESSGTATIDGAEIYQVATPQATGFYKFYFTYLIANETLKAVVDVEVD
jgi:uncharacterized protein YfaP (DUF2135 family)